MSAAVTPSTHRRLTAITLAQYAANTLRPAATLRRMFVQRRDTLDLLTTSSGEPLETMLRWSQTKLLGGESGLQSLDCARLVWGDDRTAALAIFASTMPLYTPEMRIENYRRSLLAVHQLSVAWAAESIARRAGLDTSMAFLVGSVHDIGFLALERLARPRFTQVLESLDRVTSTSAVERELFDCDHAMVGAELLRQWGAPDDVCEAVQWHHQPLGACERMQPVTSAVCLANYLVTRMGKSSLGVQNIHPPADEIFVHLGLGYRELSDTVDHLSRTLTDVDDLMM